MKIDQIHPELRQVIRWIPPIPFHWPLFVTFIKFLLKIKPRAKSIPGIKISEKKLAQASVRIYQPEGALSETLSGAALLWIHGGGLLIGNSAMNDRECAMFAKDLRLVVLSVEYRLAPEFRFPCAIDDCFEVWLWLQKEARHLGIDPARIAISGQSAGGGLAASLCQRIVDEGGVQPVAQALFCPMLDDRTAAKQELDVINHRIWNNKSNRAGWSAYLGHAMGSAEVPEYAVAARRKDLSGLPVTWIGIGDIDLFYEEDCLYSARLREAGVPCELDIIPMAPHGFETLVPKASLTKTLYERYYLFLKRALSL